MSDYDKEANNNTRYDDNEPYTNTSGYTFYSTTAKAVNTWSVVIVNLGRFIHTLETQVIEL